MKKQIPFLERYVSRRGRGERKEDPLTLRALRSLREIKFFSYVLLLLLPAACNNNTENKTEEKTTAATTTGFAETTFGTYDTSTVVKYTLTNPSGMQVSILNYGGTIT